ncbi:MAG: hypothetical protein LIR50_21280 [Bacillota bacterium]|nr:hypothetical protein [Bacillota bacterium]
MKIENKDETALKSYKKWQQIKMKDQIIASSMLRDRYIKFVFENNKKPNNDEIKFITAAVFTELGEKQIFIKDNEIIKYFKKKIPDFDKSIEKLKD